MMEFSFTLTALLALSHRCPGHGRGALSADSWEVTDIKVNVLNKDAAVVAVAAL